VIALIQRVAEASVSVGGETVAAIGVGIVALVGVERADGEPAAARLAARVLGYRIFPDEEGRMNRSLLEARGALLAVPQFTLVADTKKGSRASFSSGASPQDGRRLFDLFVSFARRQASVETGRFGVHMRVRLVNDGPVTFWLQV
jgi:D-tyrosyl-tRNA(Tyr) deacylase